jgi:hypothetical protein
VKCASATHPKESAQSILYITMAVAVSLSSCKYAKQSALDIVVFDVLGGIPA